MNIETTLKSIYKRIKQLNTKFVSNKLERRLKKKNTYYYKFDWASQNYDNWEKWLAELKGKENSNFLEIGSQEGRSAVWFLTNILTHKSSRLTCVDPMFGTNEQIFNHNIKLSGAAEKVTLIKKQSDEALVNLNENSYDFIYIDGSHNAMNVLADSVYSWELLKQNGLLLFDDYLWEPNKPKHKRCKYPIDLFLKNHKNQIDVLHKGYQVLIRKRV